MSSAAGPSGKEDRMKEVQGIIKSNEKIAENIFRMKLAGDFGMNQQGQFVNIRIEGYYLRRPISVSEYDEEGITIIYKIMGHGTEKMSRMKQGEVLSILAPLGNGFRIWDDQDVLVLGGGIGAAPMIGTAKELKRQGKNVHAVLGFNTSGEVFGLEELKHAGIDPVVCTADGSHGEKGFVTDVLDRFSFRRFYICGPEAMLKAVDEKIPEDIRGSLSFEARMGCGFGACMGCSCETKYGNLRICKEGPVLEREVEKW